MRYTLNSDDETREIYFSNYYEANDEDFEDAETQHTIYMMHDGTDEYYAMSSLITRIRNPLLAKIVLALKAYNQVLADIFYHGIRDAWANYIDDGYNIFCGLCFYYTEATDLDRYMQENTEYLPSKYLTEPNLFIPTRDFAGSYSQFLAQLFSKEA